MTIKQVVEKFEKCPEEIRDKLKDFPDDEVTLYHCIKPRDKKEVETNELGLAIPKKRAFSSTYFAKGIGSYSEDSYILDEGGYYEFPCLVTRWSTLPGEVYGRGPGHIALPDVRSLNEMRKYYLYVLSRVINPPWLIEEDAQIDKLDLSPGKVNYIRDLNKIRELISEARFDVIENSILESENKIRSLFYLDKLFLPPRQDTGEMTAFEIQQRLSQMQKVLGPTLSRLNSEFLTPLIVRVFNILLRADVFPPMPPILKEKGLNIDIRFINPLTRSQEIEEINNIRSFLVNLSELAQVSPSVVDNLDADAALRKIANLQSIPPSILRNKDDISKMRQQRQQSEELQQTVDKGVGLADIISKTRGVNGGA